MPSRTPLLSPTSDPEGREEGVAREIEREVDREIAREIAREIEREIDRYVASTSLVLTRVLGERCRAFAEPRSSPAPSAGCVGYLVETLLGVATGAVLGQVLGGLRRTLDGEVIDRVSRALREALRHLSFPPSTPSRAAIRPVLLVLEPVPRPLVDELWVRLHGRLAGARAAHRELLTRMAAAIPADRLSALAALLGGLQRDTLLACVWSRHLELAWRFHALAAGGGTTDEPALPPELSAGTAAETWRAWLRRVRGEAEPPRPSAREASSERARAPHLLPSLPPGVIR
jgi:hypothetical protein